ncbi:MAG TPA: DUF805 domain-containing protein [Pseudolabrys sp.]|nr:DUF805 domain-containing protein [Pseudolabrys sp.]
MNFGEAVVSGLRNYINFSGRASRSEFWFFTLFFNLVLIGIGATTDFLHSNPVARERFGWLAGLIFFALLLPAIAISVRRLHDIDRTGWWVLIGATIIGHILLLVWFCTKGTAGRNRFGPSPLAAK